MDDKKILGAKKAELEKKYKIDFTKLEAEQIKIAKDLDITDKIDFVHAEKFGAFDVLFIKNKMLCCVVVCDKNREVIDQAYSFEKVVFPYVPGFRNYRELPVMIMTFEKLNVKPDLMFMSAQGIIHPRLGLASHFGLVTGIPTIGVSNVMVDCTIEGEASDGKYIFKNGKRVGKIVIEKRESNPLYVSPGDHISINTAYELTKKMIYSPHKRPHPLPLASKYVKKVKEELF